MHSMIGDGTLVGMMWGMGFFGLSSASTSGHIPTRSLRPASAGPFLSNNALAPRPDRFS